MPDPIAPAAPAAPAVIPGLPPYQQPDRLTTVLKDARYDPALVFEETIKASMPPAEPGEKPAPARDPTTGKFVAKSDQLPGEGEQQAPVEQGVPPVEGEPGAEEPEAEAEVVIPEGYVSPPTLPEDRARGFRVRDKDGELEPPDLTWEIATANGARQFSTDQLVNLARDGQYNHQLFQQNQEYLETLNRDRADYNQLHDYAQALENTYLQLMSNEDAYVSARAQWANEHTPEAMLQRERERAQQAEQRVGLVQLQAAGTGYYQGTIEPALRTIQQALPTVTGDEIGMRLLLVTDHLRVPTEVGNIYPASAYKQVEQALLRDVLPWAQAMHAHRQRGGQTPTREAEEKAARSRQEVEAAQVRAQKARRVASAATRPVGGNGTAQRGNAGPPQTGRVLAHKDAEDAVIGSTLASMRER